uniref:Uncharacterized protein n=1 Tax=Arundo donax TaxID=35708 RepID=A0A0A8ZMU3_ARUDO
MPSMSSPLSFTTDSICPLRVLSSRSLATSARRLACSAISESSR